MPFEDQCPAPHTPCHDAELVGYIDAEFSLPFLQVPAISYETLDHQENDGVRGGAREADQSFVPSPLSAPFLPGDQPQIPKFQNTEHGASRPGDMNAENCSSMHATLESVPNPSLLTPLQPTDTSTGFLSPAAMPDLNSGLEVGHVLRGHPRAVDTLRAAYYRSCYTPKGVQGSEFPVSAIPSSTVTQDAHCNQATAAHIEGSLLLPGAHREISSSHAALQGRSAFTLNSGQYIADVIGPPASSGFGGTSHVLHPGHVEAITSPRMQDLLPGCGAQRTPTTQSFDDSAITGGQDPSGRHSATFCVEDFLPEHGLGVASCGIRKSKAIIPKMTKHALEQIANEFTGALGDDFPVLEDGPPLELQPLMDAYRGSQVQPTSKGGTVKTTRKPRAKKEKVVQPLVSSKHCHICARSGQPHNLAGCRNLHVNGCRKVVCRKCYNSLRPTCSFEQVTAPADKWECTHCRGMCPEKAQCVIYAKTNARRRDINLQKKKLAASKTIRKHTPVRSSKNPCAAKARPGGPSATGPSAR